jgi:hypothetical protein
MLLTKRRRRQSTKIETTAQLHLSRLVGTAKHPDMQEIRITAFFFGNRLNWQFEVRLLLYTLCTSAYGKKFGHPAVKLTGYTMQQLI